MTVSGVKMTSRCFKRLLLQIKVQNRSIVSNYSFLTVTETFKKNQNFFALYDISLSLAHEALPVLLAATRNVLVSFRSKSQGINALMNDKMRTK